MHSCIYTLHLGTKEKKIYVCVLYLYSYAYICSLYIHEIVYAKSKERLWIEKETNSEGKKQ